jgi:predicted adenine nucleotide alpha hydrolase (AANH) superfamily ATPase
MKLKEDYKVTLFFYNSNIYPETEYLKRYNEIKKWAEKEKIVMIQGEFDQENWFSKVKGLEQEPEGGVRCAVCYKKRLEETAKYASENDFHIFTTTLTISPHKKASIINSIGLKLSEDYNIEFIEADWKKQDGFKKACELSRQQGFYRQEYCGCKFSIRE